MDPKSPSFPLCSISTLFLFLSLLTFLISLFLLSPTTTIAPTSLLSLSPQAHKPHIKVFVANLPRSLNYGLLDHYWSLANDTRIGSEMDNDIRSQLKNKRPKDPTFKYPYYPESPLIKQYSAEYWIMGDLETSPEKRETSFARRVINEREADVVLVPFFATMSAELQLGVGKGLFRKKEGNGDYERQREVMDLVKGSEAWKRSGGRDHVFVLTDPVAMWHVKDEIAPAILLVVDFGGWYKLDSKSSKSSNGSAEDTTIQHTQVSLLKDVIVPYTHLLPSLKIYENKKRSYLLYFKGAKHRHRGGLVREKLWDLLVNEHRVIMEEGFPNATGKEQSIIGMQSSEFCLHPAGDTPTSCRLFDAIQCLCIPVIISDTIELPFEGMIDYSEFSIFVSVDNALKPNWLLQHLRRYSEKQKNIFRENMASVQMMFEYDNGYLGGIGPIPVDGAVNYIWRKIYQKLPMINEAIVREKRRPKCVTIPLRCHCT